MDSSQTAVFGLCYAEDIAGVLFPVSSFLKISRRHYSVLVVSHFVTYQPRDTFFFTAVLTWSFI